MRHFIINKNTIDRSGNLFPRSGMAIIVVLVFATALLVLGSSYIKTLSSTTPVNPILLERMQADFFAQGIAQIALLKFRKFPADFYHAFLYDRAGQGSAQLKAFCGASDTPLQDYKPGGTSIADPVPVTVYSTQYLMSSFKGYNRDTLAIMVNVKVKNVQREYNFTVDASRTRIIP